MFDRNKKGKYPMSSTPRGSEDLTNNATTSTHRGDKETSFIVDTCR